MISSNCLNVHTITIISLLSLEQIGVRNEFSNRMHKEWNNIKCDLLRGAIGWERIRFLWLTLLKFSLKSYVKNTQTCYMLYNLYGDFWVMLADFIKLCLLRDFDHKLHDTRHSESICSLIKYWKGKRLRTWISHLNPYKTSYYFYVKLKIW